MSPKLLYQTLMLHITEQIEMESVSRQRDRRTMRVPLPPDVALHNFERICHFAAQTETYKRDEVEDSSVHSMIFGRGTYDFGGYPLKKAISCAVIL